MATDEDVARALQREEDDAARALGTTREAIRERAALEAADEALARQLDAEERRGARAAAAADDDEDDGGEDEGASNARWRPMFEGAAGPSDMFSGFGAFEPLIRGAMGDVARRFATNIEERQRRHEPTTRSSASATQPSGIEFTIGRNGETTTLDLSQAFDGLVDAFFSESGGRTTILDVLNRMTQSGFPRPASHGVPEASRRALEVRPYQRAAGETEDACCSVCLSQLEAGEDAKYLPCKHVYHPECIDRWLERSKLCPVCKRDVTATVSGSH